MFCESCGTPLKEGEKFCSKCGAQVKAEQPVQNNAVQPPYGQPPYGQPPYGQPPYGQPPYGQQPSYGQPPRKSKKGLIISVTAIILAAGLFALAAFVWPGFLSGKTSANGNEAVGEKFLSGDTLQTQFVNDSAQVLEDAFDGFAGDTFERLTKEPFDMSMDLSTDVSGLNSLNLDIAYDKEALGMNVKVSGIPVKMLLKGDVLYMEVMGQVQGLDFGSEADLSKPMSLTERLTALVEGLQTSGLGGNSTLLSYNSPNLEKVVELFINSIDEKCFDKKSSKSTLSLTAEDIKNTLRKFSDAVKKDEKLLGELNDFIKQSGSDEDFTVSLDNAIEEMENSDTDFSFVWNVTYENDKPVGTDITLEAEGQRMVISFEYRETDTGKDISFLMTVPGYSYDIKGGFSFDKKSDGIEYSGNLDTGSQQIEINGSEEWSGNKTKGTIEIALGADKVSFEYDETLKFGTPSKKVADDSRFKIDTENAIITDIRNMSGLYGMPGM